MPQHDLLDDVAKLAKTQHGLVRADQMPADKRRRLRELARLGRLERLSSGIYRINGAPASWEQLLVACLWTLGPTARISHNAAARLYGFDRFEGEPLEFTVHRSCRGRETGVIEAVVHTSEIEPHRDRRRVRGLPVTSPARTVIDLARSGASSDLLESAIDSSIRMRLATLDQIADRLAHVTGSARWGVAQVDALLATSGGHSVLERRFMQLIHDAGLPMPVPQVVHRLEGRHVARVDFLFVPQQVVVEVSGGRGHSSPAERAKDATRRNDLQKMGRTVLEFTFEMVTRRPERVMSTLTDVLAASAG